MMRIFRAVYSLYAIVCYLLLLVILCPVFFVALCSGEINGGNLIYRICRLWAKFWCLLVGIQYKEIHPENESGSQNYIYVANHRSYADVVSVVRAIDRPFRILGRHDIANLPVIGPFYNRAVISVDRSDYISKAFSMLSLRKYITDGLSIFIFPEGTFNETANMLSYFHDGAFHLAIDTQTPLKPILFLDNRDRMHPDNFLSMTPGKCRVIFMEEVDVRGYTRETVGLLKEKVYTYMEQALLDYEVSVHQ